VTAFEIPLLSTSSGIRHLVKTIFVFRRKNPFCLIVAFDSHGSANGFLYWDDGDSIGLYFMCSVFVAVGVVVECVYKPHVFNRSVATSSAECSRCSPPFSLVCGQLLTIPDIVWHLPQGQMSAAARPHFF